MTDDEGEMTDQHNDDGAILNDVDSDATIAPPRQSLPGPIPYEYRDYVIDEPPNPPIKVVTVPALLKKLFVTGMLAMGTLMAVVFMQKYQAGGSFMFVLLGFWMFIGFPMIILSTTYWIMDKVPLWRDSYSAEQVRHFYKNMKSGSGKSRRKTQRTEIPSIESIAAHFDLDRLGRERVVKNTGRGITTLKITLPMLILAYLL